MYKSRIIKVKNLIYVNDGAFLFNNKNDLERLTQELHRHFLKFGLKMHIGHGTKELKNSGHVLPTYP